MPHFPRTVSYNENYRDAETAGRGLSVRLVGKVLESLLQGLAPVFCALSSSVMLAACTLLGSAEERAENINLATGTYAAAAILYNVLRASEAEPLDFVSFTGVTGHETSSLGIGLPTIIIGPGRTSAQHLFLFGPNTVGASVSNDFIVNVLDDPASQAALLKPVDPATLGFFVNQGYNTDQVFFLFISKIVDIDKKSGEVVRSFENEPYGFMEPSDRCSTVNDYGLNCHWVTDFYARLLTLVHQYGLSVEVDPTFVPTQGGSGKAKFCFDPSVHKTAAVPCRPSLIPKASQMSEEQTVSGSIQEVGTQPPGDGPKNFAVAAKITPPNKDKGSTPDFEFPDPVEPDRNVYVYTRSVYGAYRFLGELLNLWKHQSFSELPLTDVLFRPAPETEGTRILNLNQQSLECWTTVHYETNFWCVPKVAVATKRTFQILHQLFRLFASPSNQPATQTVRTVQ